MSQKNKNIFAAALLGLMVLAFLNYWFNQRPGAKPTPTPQPQSAPAEQQVPNLVRAPTQAAPPARRGKPAETALPEERPAVDWDAVVAKVELDWGDDPFAIPVDENAANGQGGSIVTPGTSGTKGGRSEGPLAKLSLEGILRVRGQDSAIINDRVLQAGEEIEGFRIVSVSSRGVVLFKDGESHLLQLPATSDEDAGGGIQIRGKGAKVPQQPLKQDEDKDGGDQEEDSGAPEQGMRPDGSARSAVFLPPKAGYKTPSRR